MTALGVAAAHAPPPPPPPPSTPKSRSVRTFASHPSTTPAGPPPSHLLSAASNTPAGDPPPRRSRFDSSYNPAKSPNRYARRVFRAPPYSSSDYGAEDDDGGGGGGGGGGAEPDDDAPAPSGWSTAASSPPPPPAPRGLKRSHDGEPRAPSAYASRAAQVFWSQRDRVRLQESDRVILDSERVLGRWSQQLRLQPSQREHIFVDAAADLTQLWSQARSGDTAPAPAPAPATITTAIATKTAGVGPKSGDRFTHASYLASLLLQLHYPHAPRPDLPPDPPARPSRALVPASPPPQGIPVPQALLGWLDTHHNPFPDDFDHVHLHTPTPSAHESYWDILYAALLRGKLDRVIRLLTDAGWDAAYTAADDGASDGYTDRELDHIEQAVARCLHVLKQCPAYRSHDWDTRAMEWTVFRQRVRNALHELEAFCEGDGVAPWVRDSNPVSPGPGRRLNVSTASRAASSRVPWTVYQNLQLLYGMLLGEPDDIIMTAQDWLEASICLTVWWDGSDEAVDAAPRKGHPSRNGRLVDLAPLTAYRKRLADAFARVQHVPPELDQSGAELKNVFVPDMTDDTQVGLACVVQGDFGGALFILRTLSVPVAVAVMELGVHDRWIPTVRPASRAGLQAHGFDRDDLLVLSHGPTPTSPNDQDRDGLLEQYAELLSQKPRVGDKEGWELAVAVLNRLDHTSESSRLIGKVLEKLELTTEETVDKVLNVCDALGQDDQRKNIAERYADHLAESTQSYGPALIYYARAHAAHKLTDTVSLMTSLCLVHSAAVPDHRLIDPKLAALLTKERPALKELARVDLEAATLLSCHLSGYATLRRFYELRDQDAHPHHDPSTRALKPLERKRQAAASLFAVIKSASDCIPGGLFDPDAQTVIRADGLLALLGEALPLLGHPHRIFTPAQLFSLLAVLEDFAAAPARLRDDAARLLSAALAAHRADTASPPRAWDWRHGLVHAGIEPTELHLVSLVREALVREVAAAWGPRCNR